MNLPISLHKDDNRLSLSKSYIYIYDRERERERERERIHDLIITGCGRP